MNNNENEIFEKIVKIIKEVVTTDEEITMETNVSDLKMDSLDIMNYLFSIQDNFGIKIPEEEEKVKEALVIKNMIAYITEKCK